MSLPKSALITTIFVPVPHLSWTVEYSHTVAYLRSTINRNSNLIVIVNLKICNNIQAGFEQIKDVFKLQSIFSQSPGRFGLLLIIMHLSSFILI